MTQSIFCSDENAVFEWRRRHSASNAGGPVVKRAANASLRDHTTNVEFQDGERTFSCEAATSPATPGTNWWWVSVTGESQRYAMFRTEPTDTQANLRERVIACYTQLLVDRNRPREIRAHWAQRRGAQQAAAAAPETGGGSADAASGETGAVLE